MHNVKIQEMQGVCNGVQNYAKIIKGFEIYLMWNHTNAPKQLFRTTQAIERLLKDFFKTCEICAFHSKLQNVQKECFL